MLNFIAFVYLKTRISCKLVPFLYQTTGLRSDLQKFTKEDRDGHQFIDCKINNGVKQRQNEQTQLQSRILRWLVHLRWLGIVFIETLHNFTHFKRLAFVYSRHLNWVISFASTITVAILRRSLRLRIRFDANWSSGDFQQITQSSAVN